MKGRRRHITSDIDTRYPDEYDVQKPVSLHEVDPKGWNNFKKSIWNAFVEIGQTNPHLVYHFFSKLQAALVFGWKKDDEFLSKLHKFFIKEKFLIGEFKVFRLHFIEGDTWHEKMQWLGQLNELAFVFDYLWDEKILPDNPYPNITLAVHFKDQYGLEINPRSMRTLRGKGILDPIKADHLHKGLQEIFES